MLLMTFVQVLNFQYFGTFIQPISFYQAYAFPEEAAESFWDEIDSMILPSLIVVSIGAVMFVLSQRLRQSLTTYKYMTVLLLALFVGDLALTYILLNNKHGKLWNVEAMMVMPKPHLLALQNVFRSIKYFAIGIVPKKIFGNISMFPEIPPPNVLVNNPEMNIILIIGESLRAEQLSLLGYTTHTTTPRLSALTDLKARTIYSSGTMSITGVAGILNRLKHPGVTSQITSQSNCLFRLAKHNSFTTYFVTAYYREHMKIMENVLCKKNIDHYVTRSEFAETSSAHDMALVEYLNHIDFNTNNFIVLNQRGSHTPYAKRSPNEFKKYDSEYDNSVLYTDYVLAEIIRTVQRKSTKPTYILFTADHGELLQEEGLNGHGWFKRQVYEVPFLFFTHNVNNPDIGTHFSHIQSHYDLSTFIIQLLGYDQQVDHNEEKHVFINGSDVDGLAGYVHLTTRQGSIVTSELIR
ncbi:sulfatase-like hydrolase/transferase [Nitrospira sp. M1]